MGTQLDTQPQIFKNNVVVGSPAGGPAVYGLTVYGDISASGTIYGTGGGGGGGGGGGALAANNILGTGTDTYTLTNYSDETASNYIAFIGGVAQQPGIDFTISGNAIVFNSPVGVGIEILVYAVMNILIIPNSSIRSGTAVTLTNQTLVEFTGIPSGIKRITLIISRVSTNGNSIPLIRIGNGSVATSGYAGSASSMGTVVDTGNYTTGFFWSTVHASSSIYHGLFTLTNTTGNIWTCTGGVGASNTLGNSLTYGTITLTSSLDRVRLTTVNGINQFDAGTVNIMWE